MKNVKTHYRTCNLCEAMCGLEIKHSDGEIISIKGDNKDVFSKGHICPKALALEDLYHDKDRLKTPLKRTDSGWQEISWDEAFDEVAANLKSIQKKFGNNSVGVFRGNPNVHNLGLMLYGSPFIKSLQTQQKYSATSVDQLPHHIASLLMFGHQMMIPIPDIDRTDFMLIIGGNPAVSNGSMMTAPNFSGKLKNIKKRGGEFVVIDPRYTETAKIANHHLFIQPGKDALFLASLIYVILNENLTQTSIANHINGFDNLFEYFKEYNPDITASETGISSIETIELARKFAKAKSAVCYGRLGVSTQEFGGLCQWFINILNIITDNIDKQGGAMFTLPAIDIIGAAKHTGKVGTFDRYRSRVKNLPEFTGEFPVATLVDEITTKGEGQIKAMVTIGGNPVLSTPNGKALAEAFKDLDFMVAIDIYLNETTQFANIILPSTNGLETSHYDIAFNQLSVRNTAKYSPALFEKSNEQRHDWEILNTLTERITGVKKPVNPEETLDYLLKIGPYGENKITMQRLKEHPHGIDLGALKPCLPERLFTKSQKIEIAPELLVKDLKRLKEQFLVWKTETVSEYTFALIGRRHLRSNNSWMHNSKLLMLGRNRCTLIINPDDAQKLNLKEKQLVNVSSSVGSVFIPVEISTEMMPGVVSIPHGFGHHGKGTKIKLAEENAGVSINDLTDNELIDKLTGNADFSGTRVKIQVA